MGNYLRQFWCHQKIGNLILEPNFQQNYYWKFGNQIDLGIFHRIATNKQKKANGCCNWIWLILLCSSSMKTIANYKLDYKRSKIAWLMYQIGRDAYDQWTSDEIEIICIISITPSTSLITMDEYFFLIPIISIEFRNFSFFYFPK